MSEKMQLLQIQPKKNIIQISDWQDYFRDGKQFLSTAVGAYSKNKRTFTPEAIFNITAMAIEKYIMAFLMKNGDLAENHTMTDLAAALVRHTGPIPELTQKLLYLDTFQDICDLEVSSYVQPNSEQIGEIIAIGQEVERLFTPLLKSN
jgi:hypothetical protein